MSQNMQSQDQVIKLTSPGNLTLVDPEWLVGTNFYAQNGLPNLGLGG